MVAERLGNPSIPFGSSTAEAAVYSTQANTNMMDTGVPPTTPARRPRDGGSGQTPMAKRPTGRAGFDEPKPVAMTHEEFVIAHLRLSARYEQDLPWHTSMQEVLEDHAARIDRDHASIIIGSQQGVELKGHFDAVVGKLGELSGECKKMHDQIVQNDVLVKNSLAENDSVVKTAIVTVGKRTDSALASLEAVSAQAEESLAAPRQELDSKEVGQLGDKVAQLDQRLASLADAHGSLATKAAEEVSKLRGELARATAGAPASARPTPSGFSQL